MSGCVDAPAGPAPHVYTIVINCLSRDMWPTAKIFCRLRLPTTCHFIYLYICTRNIYKAFECKAKKRKLKKHVCTYINVARFFYLIFYLLSLPHLNFFLLVKKVKILSNRVIVCDDMKTWKKIIV